MTSPADGDDTITGAPPPDRVIGRELGTYRIVGLLGAGGMGEVYRAHDTRLGRDVAIKLLPQAFTRDSERLSRFEREARLLAALSHPNIGAIYGIEERALVPERDDDDGPVRALVLELIEGETLADRIGRGPLPAPDALGIARQIADALHGAHEKGIVHRDLKPANVQTTRDGRVKVLDFGLAKAVSPDVDGTRQTMATVGTRDGAVLGTVAYMSPEQARGLPVDARTDIWSFGCVLFEMLAGRRPFTGSTATDTLVSILEREPDWSALPAGVPPPVAELLRRCLQKSADQRPADIREARHALDAMPGQTARHGGAAPTRRRALWALGAAAAALLLAAGVWHWRQPVATTAAPVRALAILPLKPLQQNPENDHLGLGIADTIITRVGQIEGIIVRPTSSIRRYGSADADAIMAAEELEVDAVLDGTVQRTSDRLRVNLNLVRVSDGVSLWSGSFNTSFDDIFTVEDEIAQQVVAELRPRLTPLEQARLVRRYTSNPEAYEYYLKGTRAFGTVGAASGAAVGEAETGLKMLERAVEIDPGYALAHAQIAWGYTWLGLFSNAGPVWIERAKAALARADALDPNLAEAHVVRSLLLYSSFEGYQIVPAFEALKQAQRLNPNVGHFEAGGLYGHVGLVEPALRALQRAAEIDPTSEANRAEIVATFWFNARYQEAIDAGAKMSPRPFVWLLAYGAGGDLAGARRHLAEAREKDPKNPILQSVQTLLHVREGTATDAELEPVLRPALDVERTRRNYHHATQLRACVYGLRGQADQAVEWLRETVRNGMPNYPAFSRDVCFDRIRRSAVFTRFMAELKPVWDGYERALR